MDDDATDLALVVSEMLTRYAFRPGKRGVYKPLKDAFQGPRIDHLLATNKYEATKCRSVVFLTFMYRVLSKLNPLANANKSHLVR
jgi:hypothetical protein